MSAACSCCGGDADTVCAACWTHACWAGQLMCEFAATAGVDVLRASAEEDAGHPDDVEEQWFR